MRQPNAAMLEEVGDYYRPRLGPAQAPPPLVIDGYTPAAVLKRMEEAFRILRRMPAAVGPKSFGGNWPGFRQTPDPDAETQRRNMQGLIDIAIENEWEELPEYVPWAIEHFAELDAGARRRLAREAEAIPDKYAIARMDEALHWPARFLADYAIGADALNSWALWKASGVSIEGKLSKRKARAQRLADYVSWQLNQQRCQARRQFALDAAQWAQLRYRLSPRTREAVDNIMANARIRRDRDIAAAGVAELVFVEPAAVSPDKAISPTSFERHRKEAARRISERLK